MTDDSATLRAMADRAADEKNRADHWRNYALSLETRISHLLDDLAAEKAALLVSQSSWAKEKAELERQLAEAAGWFREYEQHHREKGDIGKAQRNADRAAACERHASRPVTVKD